MLDGTLQALALSSAMLTEMLRVSSRFASEWTFSLFASGPPIEMLGLCIDRAVLLPSASVPVHRSPVSYHQFHTSQDTDRCLKKKPPTQKNKKT